MEKTQRLIDQFNYELPYWEGRLGFEPIDVLASENLSGSYEMNAAHVFKCKRGYAIVSESGCSCYEPSWAKIDIVPDLDAVRESLKNQAKDGYTSGALATSLLTQLMGVK